jgi:hypothetical protein
MRQARVIPGALTLAAALVVLAGPAHAQSPPSPAPKSAPTGAAPAPRPARERMGLVIPTAKWTGDLDGMIRRRQLRVLVPYSKTFYFVDKGVQRGLSHDLMVAFEEI